MLARGANINWVANGAAQGGHREYAEALLAREANINWVANGAAQGGHCEYAEALLAREANINWVAQGVVQGGHLVNGKLTLRFLAFFDPQVITRLVSARDLFDRPVKIQPTLVQRALLMSKLMRTYSLDYQQAWVKTEKDLLGVMHLLCVPSANVALFRRQKTARRCHRAVSSGAVST